MKERRYLPLTMPLPGYEHGKTAARPRLEQPMANFLARPSLQHRYEHYDPFNG